LNTDPEGLVPFQKIRNGFQCFRNAPPENILKKANPVSGTALIAIECPSSFQIIEPEPVLSAAGRAWTMPPDQESGIDSQTNKNFRPMVYTDPSDEIASPALLDVFRRH
jgi:hypothetical protein